MANQIPPSAESAKTEGSNAWSRGDFDQAISSFSSAISCSLSKEGLSITPEGKSFLKILYSNRYI